MHHHLMQWAVVENNCGPHVKNCMSFSGGDLVIVVIIGAAAVLLPIIRWLRRRRGPSG